MDDGTRRIFAGQRQEAELARHLLEDAGIPVMMQSQHGAAFTLRAGDLFESYYLEVASADAPRARELIHAYFEAPPDAIEHTDDPEGADVDA